MKNINDIYTIRTYNFNNQAEIDDFAKTYKNSVFCRCRFYINNLKSCCRFAFLNNKFYDCEFRFSGGSYTYVDEGDLSKPHGISILIQDQYDKEWTMSELSSTLYKNCCFGYLNNYIHKPFFTIDAKRVYFNDCEFKSLDFSDNDITSCAGVFYKCDFDKCIFDKSSDLEIFGMLPSKALHYDCVVKHPGGGIDFIDGKIIEDPIVVYKKVLTLENISTSDHHYVAGTGMLFEAGIARLLIPKGAIVFSTYGAKCRTNKATIIDIHDRKGNLINMGYSEFNMGFIYSIDNPDIEIKDFSLKYDKECAKGIHFFTSVKDMIECGYWRSDWYNPKD